MKPIRPLLCRLLATQVAAACAALPAAAGDLIFGIGTNAVYDDNVFGISSDEIDDFTIQVVPKVRYLDRLRTLAIDVRYDPTYEYFVDESGLRGWNHYARAAFEWHPSPTTSVSLEDDFFRYRSTRLLADPTAGTTPLERGSRDPFNRNIGRLALTHAFSPRSNVSLSAYHVLWDFTQANRIDQESYGGSAQYLHTVAKNVQMGAELSFSRAEFQDEPGRATADTNYYSATAVIEWEPIDRLVLHAAAGPAYVDGRKEEPEPPPGVTLLGPIPAIDPGSDVTAFANVSATWELERGALSLAYQRRDDIGGGIGFSAVSNAVTAHARYDITRKWLVEANVVWEGRDARSQLVSFVELVPSSVLPVLIEGDQRLDSVTAALSTTYRIRENTKVFASARWRSQDDDSEIPSGFGDVDRLTVLLGITHQFAAIRW
jgi:hypothetical protein